jgi:hypothetical protein
VVRVGRGFFDRREGACPSRQRKNGHKFGHLPAGEFEIPIS